jgi:hypothetical protein
MSDEPGTFPAFDLSECEQQILDLYACAPLLSAAQNEQATALQDQLCRAAWATAQQRERAHVLAMSLALLLERERRGSRLPQSDIFQPCANASESHGGAPMQEHELRVGDELVLEGGTRLTILAVEGGEALLGITPAHPGDEAGPRACSRFPLPRPRQARPGDPMKER